MSFAYESELLLLVIGLENVEYLRGGLFLLLYAEDVETGPERESALLHVTLLVSVKVGPSDSISTVLSTTLSY